MGDLVSVSGFRYRYDAHLHVLLCEVGLTVGDDCREYSLCYASDGDQARFVLVGHQGVDDLVRAMVGRGVSVRQPLRWYVFQGVCYHGVRNQYQGVYYFVYLVF